MSKRVNAGQGIIIYNLKISLKLRATMEKKLFLKILILFIRISVSFL